MHNPLSTSLPNDNQKGVKELQKNIAALYRERIKILSDITQKQREKKFLNTFNDEKNKLHSVKSETNLNEHPRKLIKTDTVSGKSTEEVSLNNPQKGGEKADSKEQNNQSASKDKYVKKPGVVPQSIADRNRRIFGGLTMHLKKAGEHLQSQAEKEKELNSKLILNKFISKQKQQREEQEQRKKEQIEIQLSRLQGEKKENSQKVMRAENQLLSEIVRCHMTGIGKFWLTKTEPKIFWKPNKTLEDQEKCERMRVFTEKQLKRQEQELVEKVMGYSQVFEHGKRTEPELFWKPGKPSKLGESLIADTQIRLNQKSLRLIAKNQEYYKSRQDNSVEEQNKEFSDDDSDSMHNKD